MNGFLLPGERMDDLGRRGMRIIQDPAGPCFSVDAVLLADFARVKPGDAVLDLGTGTGVLPLLMAAKEPACQLTGLELLPQMADMARRSVALNGLEQQISIVCGDVREAPSFFGNAAFQRIVCNPPYYKVGAGRGNQEPRALAARSEGNCPLFFWVEAASRLLAPLGWAYFVHRAARAGELIGLLEAASLHVEVLRPVAPSFGAEANLVLVAARKQGKGETHILPTLAVYDAPGCYSAEMEAVYAGRAGENA